ncbi:hypothetical protein ACGFZK_31645 [Streptomyces sp. NPDC048257]|uniref:hypothetical protein n=1 Tax=Streptomyces sp. NPDC048257 TaxID=3365526 RepID=UPI003717C542
MTAADGPDGPDGDWSDGDGPDGDWSDAGRSDRYMPLANGLGRAAQSGDADRVRRLLAEGAEADAWVPAAAGHWTWPCAPGTRRSAGCSWRRAPTPGSMPGPTARRHRWPWPR